MELKRVAKKEGILVCIAMIVIYFTEFTRLEFWIYEHLRLLQTCLVISASLLILVYVTRNVLIKFAKWSANSPEKIYAHGKRIKVSCLARLSELSKLLVKKVSTLFKKLAFAVKKHSQELYLIVRDIIDVRLAVPEKVTVAESLAATCRKIKSKNFVYKAAAVALSNTLILLFLIKGLKIESNSIIIPDYLEIQFLAYKAFILIRYKAFIGAQIILRYFTPQNILLVILTTSVAYVLSVKRFREIIKNLLLEAFDVVTIQAEKIGEGISKKVSEESKILQSDVKDVANKQTWQQIKKEASLFKEELSTWEARKKLLALAAASFIIIIMISGSLNHESNSWTSFVAATAGELCDGAYDSIQGTYRRCEASETCCLPGGKACSTAQASSYQCYNAAGGGSCGGLSCNYDNDEGACSATYSTWWCNGGTPGTACNTGAYTTKTNNPWVWGQATTIGYETGTTASCCGDDTGTPEYYVTCNADADLAFDGNCDATDKGCCKVTTKCADPDVASATTYCYATGTGYKVTGISDGNDRFAYCLSNTWKECDTSEAYCETSGCAADANFPLQGTDGGSSSWVVAGEAGVGEYASQGATGCCGDDTSEYYRTSTGYSSDASEACCDASKDCVLYSTCNTTGTCYGKAPDVYCNDGSWADPDTTQSYCETCTYTWYSTHTGGSGYSCCGDDGGGDDFYLIINNTGSWVNDTCMFCDNGVNDSHDCYGNFGCHAAGELVYSNSSVCKEGPGCYCISGQNCTSAGYETPTLVEGPILENCTTGGVYNNMYADCFTDGPGPNLNGSCRYSATDPCTEATGLAYTFANSTCADEGNESADGWYCYYDEGCSTTGPNPSCTQGSRRPYCDYGGMDGSGADCREDDVNGTLDYCHYNGDDACPAWDGGPEGGWSFTNDTGEEDFGVPCEDCDQGFQDNFGDNKCYYGMSCTVAGWGGHSTDNCFEWCWASDLTTANCFGSQTLLNRTEPANSTSCYFNRGCDATGCTSDSATMRHDFCDQCEPAGVTQGNDYCPEINASCSSNCANSGDIWYGADGTDRCTDTACGLTKDGLTIGDVWGGNSSAAFCDDSECKNDCVMLGNGGGSCDDGVCVCAAVECDQGCMFIRNSTEQNVTIFTYTGNMFITGSLLSAIGAPDGSDFIIKDSADANKAWINDVNGSIGLAGLVYQNMAAYCTPAGNAYTIKDKSENCVAYINSSGDLWLRGNLTQNANINP